MLDAKTAKLTAEKVLERVRQADKSWPRGSFLQGMVLSAQLLEEWPRIELILERTVARADDGE